MFLTLKRAWMLWTMAFCGWMFLAAAGYVCANLDEPVQDRAPAAAKAKTPVHASQVQWAKRLDAEAPPVPPSSVSNSSKTPAKSSSAGSVPAPILPAATLPAPIFEEAAGSVPANISVINPTDSKSFVVQAAASHEPPPPPQDAIATPPTPPSSAAKPNSGSAAKPSTPTRVTKDHSPALLDQAAAPSRVTVPGRATAPGQIAAPGQAFESNQAVGLGQVARLGRIDFDPAAAGTGAGTGTQETGTQETGTQETLSADALVDDTVSSQPRGRAGGSVALMHIGDQAATTARKPSSTKFSIAAGSIEELPPATHRVLDSIEFDDTPLSEAMRLFSEQSGLNVITSAEAGRAKVTVYLKDVTALDALEAIVKANGLFYRIEAGSGIVRIATSKEYEKDLSSFREEQTRVFTLLYPNPIAVAQVIQQVFGSRVQMNRADADIDDLVDLSRRFNRFDMVDGRSLGLGSPNNSGAGGNSLALGNRGAMGGGLNAALGGNLGGNLAGGAGGPLGGLPGMNGTYPPTQFAQNPAQQRDHASLNNLSASEIQQLENQIAQQGQLDEQSQAKLLQRRDATIYISTIRRNNQIIVRTGDNRSMEQIAQLITQLDVPTPTVLLEVKVLRVVLADGFNSAFEYFGASGNASTAMSDGALAPAFPGASTVARGLGAGLGVSGGVPGSLTFQMVDDKFRVRMQLLESKNCVTALATPLILTANNEVSRIFVGDTLPFTVGFTPSQVLSSVSAVNGAVAATPITELRDVGQSLLITPNINADRTVTLRVIEENSERVVAGSSIPVPATSGTGVTNVNVDTVRRRTISGTIVAQDGMAVALGGLIEEQVHDARDQVPVLGNIPGLGLLFRRQASGRSRSELVVIVRPYVFNTPTESAATSEMLLGELSVHPNSPEAVGTTHALPCKVTRSEAESSQRAKLFQLHNRALTVP